MLTGRIAFLTLAAGALLSRVTTAELITVDGVLLVSVASPAWRAWLDENEPQLRAEFNVGLRRAELKAGLEPPHVTQILFLHGAECVA